MSTALLRVNLYVDPHGPVYKLGYTQPQPDASETVSRYHLILERLHITSGMQATLRGISANGTSIPAVPDLFRLRIAVGMTTG